MEIDLLSSLKISTFMDWAPSKIEPASNLSSRCSSSASEESEIKASRIRLNRIWPFWKELLCTKYATLSG